MTRLIRELAGYLFPRDAAQDTLVQTMAIVVHAQDRAAGLTSTEIMDALLGVPDGAEIRVLRWARGGRIVSLQITAPLADALALGPDGASDKAQEAVA